MLRVQEENVLRRKEGKIIFKSRIQWAHLKIVYSEKLSILVH